MTSFLGKKLRDLRNEHGHSQSKLAQMLGKKKGAISSYENGRSNPPLEVIKKISSIYNIHPSDLFSASKVEEDLVVYGSNVSFKENGSTVSERWSFLPNGEYKALVMKGTSMEPDISPGDLVIYENTPLDHIQDQMLVVIYFSDAKDNYTLGVITLDREEDEFVIYPRNKGYRDIRVDPDHISRVHRIVKVFRNENL